MAYCRVSPLPAMKELTDNETKEILAAGMEVLVPEVKKNLQRVIKGQSEANLPVKANLRDNIITPFGTYKGKRCISLSFKGKIVRENQSGITRNRGRSTSSVSGNEGEVRRDEIAAVLEYGKQGQPPTHFLRDSLNSKQREIDAAIRKKFEEIVSRNNNS